MLHLAIGIGLILGLAVGIAAAMTGNQWLMSLAEGSAPFGAVFMNAIKMVVIPLIITVIFSSIAGLGDPRKLGRIGGLTLGFYWITLIPAIIIAIGADSVFIFTRARRSRSGNIRRAERAAEALDEDRA